MSILDLSAGKLAAVVTAAAAFVGQGAEIRLAERWEFQRGESGSKWESVTIPHDWAIGGEFDISNDYQVARISQDGELEENFHTGRTGALPWVGAGRYRRRLSLPADARHAELVFDGAMNHPVVFVNGREAGRWAYGYNTFRVPLDSFLPATELEVLVCLTNPPSSSRWYPGSGLFRPVRLVTGGETGLETWGTFARTVSLGAEGAQVAVDTEVYGPTAGRELELEWSLLTAAGQAVAGARQPVVGRRAAGRLTVGSPQLWTPETPTRYRLVSRLWQDGQVVDERQDWIGIRTVAWTRQGFLLNGQKRNFRGVCLHHDLGPLGAAFNASAFRRRLRLLRSIGVDAIRTSHNMPSEDAMAICDEEGFMVMAESFDMWRTPECPNDYARDFPEWWERDLTNLIVSKRNHPSIVMWSIGNEIHENDANYVAEMVKRMQEVCHRLDPSRPVTFVTDRPDAYLASGALQAVDIPALTYRLPRYEFTRSKVPLGLVFGGETASTYSSRSCYHFPPVAKADVEHPDGQSNSYDLEHGSWSNLPDDDFAMQDDHDWVVGEFVWTGMDYLGEPTPYKQYWPSRSSYFGLFDLAGLPKDRAYLYRARWRKDSPTLQVLPHWTWPGREGELTPVYVYTSYPAAELFLNGKSQGRRTFDRTSRLDRYRLRWNEVRYEPGELKVVAFDADGQAVAETVVRTAGEPVRLVVEPEVPTVAVSCPGEMPELAYFRVQAVDAAGNWCPQAEMAVEFQVEGAGRFKAVCNGDATSLESFVRPTMKLFRGRLVVTAEVGRAPGELMVKATAAGLQPGIATLSVKELAAPHLASGRRLW